ncbi:hypothetical protein ACFQZZ_26170 [Nocardia sp. GCM10030253]|uniref:hypothetical protein n=1 Tax=Nocardia sp. GCM10030253 TaxID=3273404 RepID=UPI00363B93A4
MIVIVLGAVVLLTGFLLGIPLLVTAGIVVLIIGAVLMFMGSNGRSMRGWRSYSPRPRRRRSRARRSW